MNQDLEQALRQADFSKDTDLKERLAAKLFRQAPQSRIVSFRQRALSDEEAELVTAALGLPEHRPEKETF